MNASYGKSILKPIEYEILIIDNEKRFNVYIDRNYNHIHSYNVIKGVEKIGKFTYGDKFRVKRIKTVDEHLTAEDNEIPIYYQETDSLHLLDNTIKKLEKVYNEKYNRELIGKNWDSFIVILMYL